MKTNVLFKTTFLALSLVLHSCSTAPVYDSSSQWRTTENGITVWSGRHQIDTNHQWIGPVDREKKAHGFGKFVQYNPDVPGDPFFGGGFYENTVTCEGKMVHGRFEGEVIRKMSYNGKVQRDQYQNGEWVSADLIRAGNSSGSGSSGLSDGQLIGGMYGLAGLAAGDSRLAGAGATLLSGNESAGLQQVTNWAKAGPGGAGSRGGLAGGGGSGVQISEGNLIDEWKLRSKVKKSGDHMSYYIQAADQAYASYKKSGEKAYYAQHKEYASLARDFHERTGTETQGYSR